MQQRYTTKSSPFVPVIPVFFKAVERPLTRISPFKSRTLHRVVALDFGAVVSIAVQARSRAFSGRGEAFCSLTPTRRLTMSRTSPTKKDQILRKLRTKSGSSIADLAKITNWQEHSVRSAITGLRKAGNVITCIRSEGKPSRYRIVEHSQSDGDSQ